MGLTGTRISVEISHQAGTGRLRLTYRWWTSDPDPWVAEVPGMLGANSRTWDPTSMWGGTAFWGKDREGERRILELKRVGGPGSSTSQPFMDGQSGEGRHNGVGGKIPGIPTPSQPLSPREQQRFDNLMSGQGIGAHIKWEVISVG
jgi:hypothetical protein